MEPKNSTSKKQLLAVLIIVLALTLLFMFGIKMRETPPTEQEIQQIQEVIQSDPITQEVQVQSSSDEVDSIEADLATTDIDILDQ